MNKFSLNQTVVYNGNTPIPLKAMRGALAKVKGVVDTEQSAIVIEWMESPLRNGQEDGQYMSFMFDPVPQRSAEPWFSYTINRDQLKENIARAGLQQTYAMLHESLDKLISKILASPDPNPQKVEAPKALPEPYFGEHPNPDCGVKDPNIHCRMPRCASCDKKVPKKNGTE